MEKRLFAFWLSLLLAESVCAGGPVYFPDAKLKAAVEEELWICDPTPTDMLALTQLYCEQRGIRSLTGLEYATNLQIVSIKANRGALSSLSPLAGLTGLRTLVAEENSIEDISALSGLTNLRTLSLQQNCISDISALSALTNLETVSLHRNQVSDISPLADLTSLKSLDLRVNPLNDSAFSTYIPQITANNPGISLVWDPEFSRRLSISSSAGGTVTEPGEGDFLYGFGDVVLLEARPDPGFLFVEWSGTFNTSQNPLLLTLEERHQLLANFQSTRDVIYVDDDAPHDPGAGDTVWSDPNEAGTPEHPFDSIQEALDVAAEGSTVVVLAGVYRECIEFPGRNIHLKGFCPDDANGGNWPVMDGDERGPVVVFANAETPDRVISGFVITGGKGRPAGAILCSHSSPTVANCLIAGNRATNWNGGAVRCTDSNAVFVNCTITDNYAGEYGAGLCVADSRVVVANSILWGNGPSDVSIEGVSRPSIRYSILGSGWQGPGNLTVDPLFASLGRWVDRNNPAVEVGPETTRGVWVMGDYHVRSQVGRWDSQARKWQQDKAMSPCIDAGDPSTSVGYEPLPNGGIANLGVYGSTAEASKSWLSTPSPQATAD